MYIKYDTIYDAGGVRELIVGVNNETMENKEKLDKFFASLCEVKNLDSFIAMEERGKKKDGLHYHIILMWNTEPILNTFRSTIQRYLGKSHTCFDWKYRKVKSNLKLFFEYIFKDEKIYFNHQFNMEVYNFHKGKWNDIECKKRERKSQLAKIKSFVEADLCAWCVPSVEDTDFLPCMKCCATGVLKYYDANEKTYDFYHMKKLVRTIYYKSRPESVIELLCED